MIRARATNDVPPDILDDDRDDEAVTLEDGSDVEFDLDAAPDSVKSGTAVIRRFWATLPSAPGVYRMLNGKGEVLYVGKARDLKARVGTYARGQGHSSRINRMIAQTVSMEFVTTETETEALLLEANLIKQLKPRYNVLMRDDKSLPFILLTGDTDTPQVVKHRGARTRKGDYYGPFATVWAVNRTINALQRAFLLRSCNDSYYENRTRPCLLFQIKRCSAPCTGEIAIPDYQALADEARAFLAARSSHGRDADSVRELGIRARGALSRPARGARRHPGHAGGEHTVRRGGGRVRDRRAGRAVLRGGFLLPQLAELGQPGLFSARRQVDD
jgi:excinuclease ABC subunit C